VTETTHSPMIILGHTSVGLESKTKLTSSLYLRINFYYS
jgi:hypothetical protein